MTAEAAPGRIGTDPAAFEVFYREHYERVARFAARRVGDPYTAADLTAEVFLAVIDSAHTYRPGKGTVTGWLYGVARNVVADHHRRVRRDLAATGRLAGRRLLDGDGLTRMEERLDAERTARDTLAAMASLPDRTRALLELVAVDGLTSAEAADALGMSHTAARVRLHRARKTLTALVPVHV
ncbi:DNA-directed RNA polymerase sigma-70 factor [Actinorhabdospora filicis]|uniref:DNA-directed RNA polymerase sigma-70 factor n=1 Tax=Actinorhabdospora filicis TaxID=1785913 RepID=A0A9W6SQT3_9ACTN|nr:sigma-70 family RNA polymerase sigma factor [Actinorhabdospora filicis]GLZ80295.1 DNA-directed RNA polymerase sigma-70 factor [Actinorhabdospora filicis]